MSSPAPLSDAWFFRLVDAAELIEDDDPYAQENYVDDAKVSALLRAAVAEALEWAASRCRVHLEQDSEGEWIGVGGGWEYAAEHFNDEITAKAKEVRDGAA